MEAEVSAGLNAAGDGVEAVVTLPPTCSAADVLVEVLGDDVLLVQLPGADQPLHVALPLAVDPCTARVRFKRATGRLTFTAAAASTGSSAGAAPAPPDGAAIPAPTESLATLRLGGSDAAVPLTPDASAVTPGSSLAPPPPPPAREPESKAAGTTAAAAPSGGEAPPPVNTGRSHIGNGTASEPAAAGGRAAAGRDTAAAPKAAGVEAVCAAGEAAATCDGGGGGGGGGDGGGGACSGAGSSDDVDDAALYRDFFSDFLHSAAVPPLPSPLPPSPLPPAAAAPAAAAAAAANGLDAAALPADIPQGPTCQRVTGAGGGPAAPDSAAGHVNGNTNAGRVAAAFEPTGGTSSRNAGFSFTAPELPPPPPLPPGLPPVAPPIDCRYLAVANGLRVSGHAGTAALAEAMGLRRRPSAAAERRKAERVAEILQAVAATLDAYGYAVLDNYISEAAIKGARAELRVMEPHYSPGMIWVGKEAETGAQISVSSVRGDVVLWLDDQALNATAFVKDGVRRACSFLQLQQMLADVDELVFEGLRTRLPYLAGLHRRSDAMMAVYPGKGARFAKHVDNTTGDGRRLTVLTYLNPDWQERQGGALRLFPVRQGAAEAVDVLPLSGRVALFLSAEVAHEVMPSFAPRHAVTLWYFDAGEHAAALTAAKVLPGASSRPTAQAAATALLRDLLADEASSGIQPTPEGCAALATRVAALEPGAQQLLAAVLGLPSNSALVESMRALTPDSLRRRREELRNMGLGSQHHAPDTSAHV